MWCVQATLRLAPAIVAALAVLTAVPAKADPPEIEQRGKLRVCADGNNMPFSNEDGDGFENRIAGMMADELGVPLSFVWAPQVMGFVRNTLDSRLCDVIIGVAAGNEFVRNTKAYYRSVYAIVLPPGADFAPADLRDEGFRGKSVGVVSDTPPMVPLRASGARIEHYQLQTDTRVSSPARDAVDDVADGATDAAVIWGPIAGYHAARHDPPLEVVPLNAREAGDTRVDYRITMGMRRGEPAWEDWINDFIDDNQDKLNEILAEYGVPLVDSRGRPVDVAEAEDDE